MPRLQAPRCRVKRGCFTWSPRGPSPPALAGKPAKAGTHPLPFGQQGSLSGQSGDTGPSPNTDLPVLASARGRSRSGWRGLPAPLSARALRSAPCLRRGLRGVLLLQPLPPPPTGSEAEQTPGVCRTAPPCTCGQLRHWLWPQASPQCLLPSCGPGQRRGWSHRQAPGCLRRRGWGGRHGSLGELRLHPARSRHVAAASPPAGQMRVAFSQVWQLPGLPLPPRAAP